MNRLLALAVFTLALPMVACAAPSPEDDAPSSNDEMVSASAAITLKNWVSHPKIVKVRDVVREIDSARAARRFKSERKSDLCPDGIGEDYRVQVKDREGKVRMLEMAAGSDDSYSTRSLYFDDKGRLRFAFEARNDVHGNARERRVYFGDDGARIWEVVRSSHDQEIASRPFESASADEKLEIGGAEQNGTAFASQPSCR